MNMDPQISEQDWLSVNDELQKELSLSRSARAEQISYKAIGVGQLSVRTGISALGAMTKILGELAAESGIGLAGASLSLLNGIYYIATNRGYSEAAKTILILLSLGNSSTRLYSSNVSTLDFKESIFNSYFLGESPRPLVGCAVWLIDKYYPDLEGFFTKAGLLTPLLL